MKRDLAPDSWVYWHQEAKLYARVARKYSSVGSPRRHDTCGQLTFAQDSALALFEKKFFEYDSLTPNRFLERLP